MNQTQEQKKIQISFSFVAYILFFTIVATLILPTLTVFGITSSVVRFLVYVSYLIVMIGIGKKMLYPKETQGLDRY